MTKSNSATLDVDLSRVETKTSVVGNGNTSKSLVQLPLGNVRDLQTGTLQEDGDGQRRSNGEVNGGGGSISISNDLSKNGSLELLGLGAGSKQKSSSTIVQRRSIGGSDSSVLDESRAEAGILSSLTDLGPSSSETTVSPFLVLMVTGTISSAKALLSRDSMALR